MYELGGRRHAYARWPHIDVYALRVDLSLERGGGGLNVIVLDTIFFRTRTSMLLKITYFSRNLEHFGFYVDLSEGSESTWKYQNCVF